jgi:flagella basal body P-ring formation protein FlgA
MGLAMLKKIAFIFCMICAQTMYAQENQPLNEIDDVVHQFVNQSLREFHGPQGDFNATFGQLDLRLRLEQCSVPLTPSIEIGQISQNAFTVKVTCPAPKKWTVRVPVKVQVYKQVVVSTSQIMKEQPLGGNEIAMARQDITQVNDGYFQSIEELNGLVAQKAIPAGTVIKHHMVKQPTLVHRGETVRIVVEAPGIRIEGQGVAQNDGIKGQMIKIKNLRSNRMVDAMVLDTGITVVPM